MSNYIVTDNELTSVANAIRTKGGTNGSLVFPGGFTSAINAISGGGGGSSDFSTAEVVVNNYATSYLSMPFLDGEKMVSRSNRSGTFTVPLYKGEVYVDSDFGYGSAAFTATSGNVEYDSATACFKITGDCTLQLGIDKG